MSAALNSPFAAKFLGAAAALLCLAASAGGDEIADFVADNEFEQGIREGKVTVTNVIERLRHPSEKGRTRRFRFRDFFSAAVPKATASELEQLGEILRALPEDNYDFDECFSAYSTAIIRHHVARLAQKPVKLNWEPATEPLPKELAAAPQEMRAAWKMYTSAIAPYERLIGPVEKGVPPPEHVELHDDLLRVFGKPEPGAWKLLARHACRNWCWTGSESLYHPRNRAILISLLSDGKLREAAGAALLQCPLRYFLSKDEKPFGEIVAELLTAIGLDWEQVMLGSLLPVTGRYLGENEAAISCGFFGECDPWKLIATQGSDRGIRLGLTVIRDVKPAARDAVAFLSGALGSEPESAGTTVSSGTPELRRRKVLTGDVRAEVIAALAGYLSPSRSPQQLNDALRDLPKWHAKELRAPLTALVSHRCYPVASRALFLLRAAGLADSIGEIVAHPPPIRLHVVLDGKPLAGARLSVSANGKSDPKAANDDSHGFMRSLASGNIATDKNGDLVLSLDDCVEPERIASVQIRTDSQGVPPATSNSDDAATLAIPGLPGSEPPPAKRQWNGPWFSLEIEARADGKTREVKLESAEIAVALDESTVPAGVTEVRMVLRRSGDENRSFWGGAAVALAKRGEPALFRRLQPGKYRISADVPGVARYRSGDISLTGRLLHTVKFAPGRTVLGVAIFPNGTKRPVTYEVLFRDGVEIADVRATYGMEKWEGLPFGKYRIHIPSTREAEDEQKKLGNPITLAAPADRNGARDFDFELNEKTPAVLDLGEIIVPPEDK